MTNPPRVDVTKYPAGGYVLVTPARNEQDFIERTIKSVVAQSVLPREWVIVSDSSTDRTDEIVRGYAERYPFVRLVRMENAGVRNFSAKVTAFRAGLATLRSQQYEFIGNLDADVSFAPDYFEGVLRNFHNRPRLGIAGGLILERIGGEFRPQSINRNSVAGAVQMFRRGCFEAIGGYIPIHSGGVDAAAEIMARMEGWQVETLPDLGVLHHRRVSTGAGNVFKTRFRQGMNQCLLGYHPVFECLSSIYQVTEKPYVLGALLVLAGYSWGSLRRRRKVLRTEVVGFLRREQIRRIKSWRKELTSRAKTGAVTIAPSKEASFGGVTAGSHGNGPVRSVGDEVTD